MDDELAVADLIAERGPTPHPHALLPGGGDLVADALANDLPFELGEGHEHVERHPPHGALGIERLRDRHKGYAVMLEGLNQLEKIQHRARKTIDLVNDHDIDAAGLNVSHETFKGRAVERAAGHAAIVVAVRDLDPTFPALACDVGLAGLPLGVQRVELHLEAILAGFPGIDRAAQFAGQAMQVGAAGMPVSGMTAGSALAMMFGASKCHVRPG